jgi:N-methylhydantoinase A
MDSTTVVLPGYAARVDSVGNLLINPDSQPDTSGQ